MVIYILSDLNTKRSNIMYKGYYSEVSAISKFTRGYTPKYEENNQETLKAYMNEIKTIIACLAIHITESYIDVECVTSIIEDLGVDSISFRPTTYDQNMVHCTIELKVSEESHVTVKVRVPYEIMKMYHDYISTTEPKPFYNLPYQGI